MPADYGEDTVAVSRDAVEIARSTGTLLIPGWQAANISLDLPVSCSSTTAVVRDGAVFMDLP